MTHQESSSDESDSSSADSVKLTEEDLEEVRRMRRRRMEEKGFYNIVFVFLFLIHFKYISSTAWPYCRASV